MKWAFAAVAALVLGWTGADAKSGQAPLHDPVFLNIGLVCQWEVRCMDNQSEAMQRALKYVRKKDPPSWRVELCNRNAARKRHRVDWIGFDHCIRNSALRSPPRAQARRTR
jgi:hypothetical protein